MPNAMPFSRAEYERRLKITRAAMAEAGIDVLIATDPSNQHWLTGYDGWSFYVHQAVILPLDGKPRWWGRAMDAKGAARTVDHEMTDFTGYPDHFVQSTERHPMQHLAEELKDMGIAAARIGVEMENYYFSAKAFTTLTESLTKCRFKMITAGSYDIAEMMRERRLHIGITATSGEVIDYATEYPLVRDPFILVTPTAAAPRKADVAKVMTELPFLRYERTQLISRQIDAHLARLKLDFPERFEIGSNLALMACVSRGIGWAITTPLGYMRAVRFHDQITAHPLPFQQFSRHISLLASPDFADTVPRDLAQSFRTMLNDKIIKPSLRAQPFLAGEFKLLPG